MTYDDRDDRRHPDDRRPRSEPRAEGLDVWIVLREQQPMAVWDSEADARADVDRRTEHGTRPDLDRKYSVEHWSVGRAVLAETEAGTGR